MAQPAVSNYSVAAGQQIAGGRYPGGKLSGAVQLADVAVAGAMGSSPSDVGGNVNLGAASLAGIIRGQAQPSFQVAPDGCWTWFTDPRAIYLAGSTYIGYIDSSGRPGITRYNHATQTSQNQVLLASLEKDDHDNVAVAALADGRIVGVYSKHNDAANGFRYRISQNPYDVGSWASEVIPNMGALVAYSHPHYLSGIGRWFNIYRHGVQERRITSTADWVTWDANRIAVSDSTRRPYLQACDNGVDRIDLCYTQDHPNNVTGCSVYHGYLQPNGIGAENFYKSDGTLIGGNGTLNPATGTLVWDGSTAAGEAWCHAITYGPDGKPWVLFARFPAPASDHRYMFARWTGSAWAVSEITDAGPPLYSGELYYTAGINFDALDPTHVYLSRYVAGNYEIQEWRTSDNGATWSKWRDITTGTPVGTINARPWSPRNHNGEVACVWWRGSYPDFNNYNTSIHAVPAYL